MAPGPSRGLLEPGNIDLTALPVVPNPDEGPRGWSTVRSSSFNIDGKETLIPTVVNGKLVSDKEAVANYRKTGRHLGKFATPEAADVYAQRLHDDWSKGNIPGVAMPTNIGAIMQRGL